MSGPGETDQEAPTSLTLLKLVKTGDNEAWVELVRDYGPLVHEWTLRSGVPSQDVADVVQDVLQSVARSMERFRRDRSGDSFRKWLRVIVSNQVRDYFRRKKQLPVAQGGTTAWQQIQHVPQPKSEELSVEESKELVLSGGIPSRVCEEVRANVKPQTWQAFWQSVIEDRSPKDVAEDMGISVWSVYQARSRVLARFRKELNKTRGSGGPDDKASDEVTQG